MKLVLLTPNADPTLDLVAELVEYERVLRQQVPDVTIGHAVIDGGPLRVRTDEDSRAAAPWVVCRIEALAEHGADAVVIDCMSQPGLAAAQRAVRIPVVGPRSAVEAAAGGVPIAFVRDEAEARRAVAAGARMLSFSSTELGGLAAFLEAELGVPVLDPLSVAFREAMRLAGGGDAGAAALSGADRRP